MLYVVFVAVMPTIDTTQQDSVLLSVRKGSHVAAYSHPDPRASQSLIAEVVSGMPLKKRMNFPTMGAERSGRNNIMRMTSFQSFAAMVPLDKPQKILEDFFLEIAKKAEPWDIWGSSTPRSSFTVNYGLFRLSFDAIGDTIPWSFVKEIADRLWEIACMGMTELFTLVYINDEGSIGVQITLSLIEESIDSTSGGSSSSYDREGSVPSGYTGNGVSP